MEEKERQIVYTRKCSINGREGTENYWKEWQRHIDRYENDGYEFDKDTRDYFENIEDNLYK